MQLSHISEGYFKPTTTHIWEEEVPFELSDIIIDILDVKICFIPGFNQSALVEMG